MRFVVPNVVVSQFHLREGDVVADFGAGSGFFMDVLSKSVGPTGRVYALDIQKPLVEKMGAMIQSQRLENVEAKWCDFEVAEGSRLQTAELDAAIVVNTLYQVENKPAFLNEVHRTLRTGGKLIVIDWTDIETGMGPNAEHLITQDDCVAVCESHGFVLDRDFPAGAHHYGLAFRKA